MLKNLLAISIFCLSIFCFTSNALACDPLGCMLIGKQDLLVLGEVMVVNKNTVEIKINFVFPQSRLLKSVQIGQSIQMSTDSVIINAEGADMPKTVSVGKKYFLSLTKKEEAYFSEWGIYEITGNGYSDAKLARNQFPDDAVIQIFINSGGTKTNLYFIDDKVYLREGADDHQIYPINQRNLLLISSVLLGIVLISMMF